jgi:hypothetical protein
MRTVRFLTSVALVLLAASSAFAQAPRENRPYRGLFGNTRSGAEQVLSVSFNVGGGYDDDVLLGDSFSGRPPVTDSPSSTFGEFAGGLSYSLSRTSASFFAQVGAGASHYAALAKPWVTSGGASTGGSFQLSDRTSFSATTGVSRQSMYFLVALPGLPPDPIAVPIINPEAAVGDPFTEQPLPVQTVSTDPILGVQDGLYTTFGANAGLGHALTRRINASLHVGYQDTKQPSLEPFRQTSAGGGLGFMLHKSLAARVGYIMTQARYGDEDGIQRLHQLDAGIDFNKALSLTRRTTLAVRTGTSALVDENRTHFYLTANATLTREVGRTWAATVVYNRDVTFLQTFREPVFADTFSASFGGMFNRHVQFQSGVGTSLGTVGVGGINNGFSNVFATSALRIGFTRNLGLSVTYAFYHYLYEDGVELPDGFSPATDRQTIRVMLNFWSALFERQRRSNASR